MEERKIEIPCNRKVRDYNIANMKNLCGLSIGSAYELLRRNGTLPGAESVTMLKRITELVKLIDGFSFPKSVPVRAVDERHMWQFRERWKKHLQTIQNKLAGESKPVYLADAVNKVLTRRKSKIKCSRIHLMWHLDLQGEEHMKPEEIATAITKFGVSDWSQVRPLANNSKYVVTVGEDGAVEFDQEEFLRLVEFIYEVPSLKNPDGLIDKLKNDIKILQEFLRSCQSDPVTYDYHSVYNDILARLQTAPKQKTRKRPTITDAESSGIIQNEAQLPELADQMTAKETKYERLMGILKNKAGTDTYGLNAIADIENDARKACELPDIDFENMLTDVETTLASEPHVTAAFSVIRNAVRIHSQKTLLPGATLVKQE